MANEATSKIDAAAEKAYAEAAARKVDTAKVEAAVEKDTVPAPKAEVIAKAVAAPKPAAKKAVAKKTAAKKTPAKRKPAAPKKAAPKKVAAKKPAAKKTATRKVAAKKAAPAKAPTKNVAAKAASPITKAKDTIMATAKNAKNTAKKTDFVETAKTVAADAQTRLKDVYAKGTDVAGEVVDFHKHNLEAIVESGKVLTSGMQDMGREAVADTKKAAEQVTEDVRLIAAVKSPTELFKLQGDFTRRNIDAAIAYSSKSTEAWMKLANEAFAPISSRASEAAERFKKAA